VGVCLFVHACLVCTCALCAPSEAMHHTHLCAPNSYAVPKHNELLRGLALQALSAPDLDAMIDGVKKLFQSLAQIKRVEYPLARAIELTHVISRDLVTQLRTLLDPREVMRSPTGGPDVGGRVPYLTCTALVILICVFICCCAVEQGVQAVHDLG